MTTEGHIYFSIALIILIKKIKIISIISNGSYLNIILGSLVACLLPDIDHPRSKIGKKIRFILIFINFFIKHRGFTHSLFSILIFSILINNLNLLIYKYLFLPKNITYSMIIGYCSHIIADMLTQSGVQLLWPYKFRIKFPLLAYLKNKNNLEKALSIFIIIISFIYK